MAFPLLPAIGAGAALFGAISGNKNQKRAVRSQEQIARQQQQLFQQANPYYGQILQMLARNAGVNLPGPGGVLGNAAQAIAGNQRVAINTGRPGFGMRVGAPPPPGGVGPGLPTGSGALTDRQLGIFAQNPEDRLRFMQAEEDISRNRDRNVNMLVNRLMRQGIGNSATAGAAVGRLFSGADQQLAGFRRQLAINAGEEQRRRLGELMAALSPGLGAGQAASNIFGQNAALGAQQMAQAGAGMGDALQNYLLYQQMRRYQQPTDPVRGVPGGMFRSFGP